jgi:uncharacterized lipoprotein YbaY
MVVRALGSKVAYAASRIHSTGGNFHTMKQTTFLRGLACAALIPALITGTAGGPAVAQSLAPPLPREALANATYPLDVAPGGRVQLKDGKFEDAQNQISVTLTGPQASRDLNGDGVTDVVVTLVASTGASGVFTYIAAVLNNRSTALPVSSALLGDRIRMRTVAIARDGEISANYLDRRFDQPMSARPTIPVTRRFRLNEGNALFASASLSNADLNHATYPLQSAKDGQASFTRGQYRDTTGNVTARILPSPRASGDLNGDRSPDSAVILVSSDGGTGTFFHLCAVLNELYQPRPVDCVLFGDRIAVTGLAIKEGVVTLNFLDRNPDEPMSARPRVPTTLEYVLEGGRLVATAGEVKIVTYACAGGKAMKVTFGKNAAVVEFDNAMEVLLQRRVASGMRYANDKWELAGKGDEAILTDVRSGQVLAGGCKAESPAASGASLAGAYQSDVLPAADASGRVITLTLATDGAATLTTQFIGKGDPIVERGEWSQDGVKAAVKLKVGNVAKSLTFEARDDGLVLLNPVEAGYGTAGLTLKRLADAAATAPLLTGVLTGTVTYRQRIALPPNAIVEVQLADIAIADAPARVVASQTITTGGAQVPIPFTLTYEPATLQPQARYAVSARITEDGKLTWISTRIYPVLTPGAPTGGIEIVVEPVPGSADRTERTVEYACAGGKTVRVTYTPDSAEVTFDGQTWALPQVAVGSGFRYDDGVWAWSGKGDTASLIDVKSNVVVADNCRARATDSSSASEEKQAVITGTVTYLQRVALPPNAIVEVRLADVSKQDVAATVIASQTIETKGAQVPIPFELVYDPARIEERMDYAVSARITIDGKLAWISTTRNPVLTRGAPTTGIEIKVEPVR